jgi:hypothetical protein
MVFRLIGLDLKIQAVPSIVAGVLPAVLQAASPAMAIAGALGGAVNRANQQPTTLPVGGSSASNGTQTTQSASLTAASNLQQSVLDPAYVAAATLTPLLTTFFEFLGGNKGSIDWNKFSDAPAAVKLEASVKEEPHGATWLWGT